MLRSIQRGDFLKIYHSPAQNFLQIIHSPAQREIFLGFSVDNEAHPPQNKSTHELAKFCLFETQMLRYRCRPGLSSRRRRFETGQVEEMGKQAWKAFASKILRHIYYLCDIGQVFFCESSVNSPSVKSLSRCHPYKNRREQMGECCVHSSKQWSEAWRGSLIIIHMGGQSQQ